MGGAKGLSCPRFVHCREETPLKHTTRKRAWLGAKAIEWESKCSPCTCDPWMAAASAGTSGPRSAGSSTRGGRALPLAGHCSDLRASYSTRCACLFVQGLRHEVCNRNRNPSLPPGLHPSGRSIRFYIIVAESLECLVDESLEYIGKVLASVLRSVPRGGRVGWRWGSAPHRQTLAAVSTRSENLCCRAHEALKRHR